MKEFLGELIRARSTADTGEMQAADVLKEHFSKFGIETTMDLWAGGRANLVARIPGNGGPGLLFLSHLDVVPPGDTPWSFDPFCGEYRDGKILGRGASDMKGGLAASAQAICNIATNSQKPSGDIWFAATAGEETDSCGVQRFMENYGTKLGPLAGAVLPEPTNFKVIVAHRGLLWLNIITKGKTAHSSAPHQGINAISSMHKFLDLFAGYSPEIPPHELLGDCTCSVTMINGGKAFNVIPDECTAGIDIRLLPGLSKDKIISELEGLFECIKSNDANFDASIEVNRYCDALETDPETDFVVRMCKAVECDQTLAARFTTDGPPLKPLGIPIVVYGPGHGHLCHQPDEFIELADLERGCKMYEKLIEEFLY